jgi:EAL domain-containing protein (putative c-di-GMP-specific phosphodiesterase class I)
VIRRTTDLVTPSTGQELAHALDDGQLEVWYQPTVRLTDGMVTGFEALARWRHPDHGVLPAAAFLGAVEQHGLVPALDEWVRRVVFEQVAAWQDDAVVGPGFRVAVIVAGLELDGDRLADQVAATIDATGVDARGLVLELSDTGSVADLPAAIRSAQRLQELGVELALADFPSQYATFELLRSLPFAMLTLDRDVVASCEGAIGEAFTRAVVDLAEPLSARIVAHGVETAGQARRLREAGCHEGRGFLWAPALPAADAERLLISGWPCEVVTA